MHDQAPALCDGALLLCRLVSQVPEGEPRDKASTSTYKDQCDPLPTRPAAHARTMPALSQGLGDGCNTRVEEVYRLLHRRVLLGGVSAGGVEGPQGRVQVPLIAAPRAGGEDLAEPRRVARAHEVGGHPPRRLHERDARALPQSLRGAAGHAVRARRREELPLPHRPVQEGLLAPRGGPVYAVRGEAVAQAHEKFFDTVHYPPGRS
ncbi:hypothetical protein OH76DRAFT_197211 [Lentinus brumalis]|uniref:Uncharacterized protein n=1 Tax=Lentinus brumalis TaxID=2498619 RepID=A0A371DI30_9APHY|nr:hypothetical protein OH76DRAFT_197211 [Polyporus brumalis]